MAPRGVFGGIGVQLYLRSPQPCSQTEPDERISLKFA